MRLQTNLKADSTTKTLLQRCQDLVKIIEDYPAKVNQSAVWIQQGSALCGCLCVWLKKCHFLKIHLIIIQTLVLKLKVLILSSSRKISNFYNQSWGRFRKRVCRWLRVNLLWFQGNSDFSVSESRLSVTDSVTRVMDSFKWTCLRAGLFQITRSFYCSWCHRLPGEKHPPQLNVSQPSRCSFCGNALKFFLF